MNILPLAQLLPNLSFRSLLVSHKAYYRILWVIG